MLSQIWCKNYENPDNHGMSDEQPEFTLKHVMHYLEKIEGKVDTIDDCVRGTAQTAGLASDVMVMKSDIENLKKTDNRMMAVVGAVASVIGGIVVVFVEWALSSSS